MAALKREGKVRWIGVSNFNVEQMKRAHGVSPITSLQPPYSAIRRDIEADILPFCKENNIGVIVYSPMASGLLTGKMTADRIKELPADDWRSRADAFKEPALTHNLAVAERLGNTPTVCRKCYIHGEIMTCYSEGVLIAELKRRARRIRGELARLRPDEAVVLSLLRSRLNAGTRKAA